MKEARHLHIYVAEEESVNYQRKLIYQTFSDIATQIKET